MGVLYIVATPIGNLEDITLRAINTLKDADVILCEDTRRTKILVELYAPKKRLLSFHQHSTKKKIEKIKKLLQEDKKIAYVCDAGTPGISDPGADLVKLAREIGIAVVPVPGVSAINAAISVYGKDISNFVFLGFLPRNRKKAAERIVKFAQCADALIIYESPNRVKDILRLIKDTIGDVNVLVAREMTKVFEEFRWDCISNLLKGDLNEIGEFTIIVDTQNIGQSIEDSVNKSLNLVDELIKKGLSHRDAVAIVSRIFGVSKKRLYDPTKNLNQSQ